MTFAPKVSLAEFKQLRKVLTDLMATRTKGMRPGTRDYLGAQLEAIGLLRLPDFYSDRSSVYFYSSDEGFFQVRPAAATEARDKILKLLAKEFSPYKKAE